MRSAICPSTARFGAGPAVLALAVIGLLTPIALAATAGEDCDDAGAVGAGIFMDSDTTTGRIDDYDLDSAAANSNCGSGQATTQPLGEGPDAVYRLLSPDDCSVAISVDPTGAAWDVALYVLQGSCNPGGFSNGTCVALSDVGTDDVIEQVQFMAAAGVTYFIVIDGVGGSDGTFDIVVDCCPDADGDLVCDAVDVCNGNDFAGDTDGDGICDDLDVCNGDDSAGDTDGDGICDDIDNCPTAGNADQADADGNGIGDVCEPPPADQPADTCGCGSGLDGIMMMPMTLLGMGFMRRRRVGRRR